MSSGDGDIILLSSFGFESRLLVFTTGGGRHWGGRGEFVILPPRIQFSKPTLFKQHTSLRP